MGLQCVPSALRVHSRHLLQGALPAWPSAARGAPGERTHPGGMNTPEGAVMGAGGFLQEGAPAKRRSLRRRRRLL